MSNETKTYFIYALVDPRNGDIRYVGLSNNPTTRAAGHVSSNRIPQMREWVAELAGRLHVPQLQILEKIDGDRDEARKAESTWIVTLADSGARLINRITYSDIARANLGKK